MLGKDILNPTTGLTLVDYLEGREGLHNGVLYKRYGLDKGEDEDTFLNSEVRGCCRADAVVGLVKERAAPVAARASAPGALRLLAFGAALVKHNSLVC